MTPPTTPFLKAASISKMGLKRLPLETEADKQNAPVNGRMRKGPSPTECPAHIPAPAAWGAQGAGRPGSRGRGVAGGTSPRAHPPDVVFPHEHEEEGPAVHLPVLPDELQRVLWGQGAGVARSRQSPPCPGHPQSPRGEQTTRVEVQHHKLPEPPASILWRLLFWRVA